MHVDLLQQKLVSFHKVHCCGRARNRFHIVHYFTRMYGGHKYDVLYLENIFLACWTDSCPFESFDHNDEVLRFNKR